MHNILLNVKYLDPGSGSLLVQLIAAGLVGGVGILLKVFWGRIRAFFKGEKYVAPVTEDDEDEEENEK
jgi:hypothetical protein